MIGKRHTDLLRDIDAYVQYLESAKLRSQNFFVKSTYIDETGRTLTCYLVARKGGGSSLEKNISIKKAAQEMGKSQQFVRIGLQRGLLPFGVAIQLSSRFTYYINPKQFYEYIGKGMSDLKNETD